MSDDPLAGLRPPGGTEPAPAGRNGPSATAAPEPEPQLVYGSAEQFLHERLLPAYNRRNDGKAGLWCPKWFLHAEAVSRVTSLWRAWEHFRLDPATGMSVWWRDHADHHMGVLLSTEGVFHSCTPTGHYDPKPYECDMAPDGWFPDERRDLSA